MDNDLPQREICALQVLNLVSFLYDILKTVVRMLDKKHNLVTLWGHLANVATAITLTRINISYLVSDMIIMGYNIDKIITISYLLMTSFIEHHILVML